MNSVKQRERDIPHVKRNIYLILSSTALGNIADAIYTLSISWYILEHTGSAFLTATITAITYITNVFAGPFVGVIVDRTNPKTAMQKAYIIMALIGLFMVFSYVFLIDYIVFSVMAMVIINDLAQSFIFPSRNRLLPRLIGVKRIAEVTGYLSSANNTSSLIGNALAGFLLSIIGFVGVMLTHTVLFLFAALLISWLVLPKTEKPQQIHKVTIERNYWNEFLEGVKVLRGHSALLTLTLMNMGTNIVSIGYLYMVILIKQYNAVAFQFGLFEATGVAVAIITGLFAGKVTKRIKPVVILSSAQIIASLCMIFFGMGDRLVFAFILFAIQTFFSVLQAVVFGTLLITLVEPQYRARVDSLVVSISAVAMPATIFLGGYLADVLPIKYIFYVAGSWSLLMGFTPLFSKDVRQLKSI